MMRRVRDGITVCVFIAMVAVSVAASVEAARQGLPEPEVVDPVERLQWLADHDVREQTKEVKLRLVRRLEADFANDIDVQDEIDHFDDAQWARFEANFADLMKIWLSQKVDTWANLPDDQKNYYIDEQYDNLSSWKTLKRHAIKEPGRRRRSQFKMADLQRSFQLLMAGESPAQRQRIEAFVDAVVMRVVFLRMMPTQFGQNLD